MTKYFISFPGSAMDISADMTKMLEYKLTVIKNYIAARDLAARLADPGSSGRVVCQVVGMTLSAYRVRRA